MGAQCKSCSESCKKGFADQRLAQPMGQGEEIQLYQSERSDKFEQSQKQVTLKKSDYVEKSVNLKSEKSEQAQTQQNTKKEQQNQNQKTNHNKECMNSDSYSQANQKQNTKQIKKEPAQQQIFQDKSKLINCPVKEGQKDILEEPRDIQCNIEGHYKSKIYKLCICNNCWESQRFICIQCENQKLHLKDLNFTIDKIIDLEQIPKLIQENSKQIKTLNSRFHSELCQITTQFEKIFIEILKIFQNLINLFKLKDLCYEQDYQIKDNDSLIKFVNDKQLIKLLTDAPLDIFLIKHQSVLQCFEKVCSNIEKFNLISQKTTQLSEEFQKLLEKEKKIEKQLDNKELPNFGSLIKQIEQSQEIESQILDSKQFDIQQGNQLIREGYIQYKLKSFQNSQTLYEKALENSHQNEQHIIYYYIGKCLLKQFQLISNEMTKEQKIQKQQEIMEVFQKTKILCPSFKKVYQQIYKLFCFLGDQEQAIMFIVKEKQIDNKDFKFLLKLGNIYKYLNQDETALLYYNKCLDIKPNNIEAQYCQGEIYFRQKNYQDCIRIMQQIIKVNKEYSDAYLLLSDSFLKLGNWKKALNTLFQKKRSFKLDQRFLDKIQLICDFHKKD